MPCTFSFLNSWRDRKPLQAAWNKMMLWDTSFSRCFSSLETTPAFRKTWEERKQQVTSPLNQIV